MEYYYKDGVIHENSEYGNAIGNIDNGEFVMAGVSEMVTL